MTTTAGRDGDGRAPAAGRDGAINIAREAPSRLGAVTVNPAHRRVVNDDGREEILEPRVMQVLVALIRAGGQIVTRDELMMSCWGGVVVGEDALNRAIGRLRRLSEGLAAEAFRVETITKVGYRLVTPDGAGEAASEVGPRPPESGPPWRSPPSHRSPSCRSKTSPAMRTRNISPTPSPRTSSPPLRNGGGSSSSPATRASPTGTSRSRSPGSAMNWASVICSPAAYGRLASGSESMSG
jgi:DNA-binding winged helix-turn-helix (wHTH) protein